MFKGDGYVHYLDCGEGFTGTYIYQNFQTVHFKYVQFIICQYNSIKLLKLLINQKKVNFLCSLKFPKT